MSRRSAASRFLPSCYARNEWRTYQAGDVFGSSDCTVRAPFAIESHRIVLGSRSPFGDPHESHKPIGLWHVGDRWLVWSDPLDTEGCDGVAFRKPLSYRIITPGVVPG